MTNVRDAHATDVNQTVEQWLEHLRMFDAHIDPDVPLGELGIDSLTAAELSAELEDAFDVVIPMDRFLGTTTLRDVAAAIHTGDTAVKQLGEART